MATTNRSCPARHPSGLLPGCLLCLLAFASASHAKDPCWRELHFVASSGLITATTTLRFDAPAPAAQGQLYGAHDGTPLTPSAGAVALIHGRFHAIGNTGELQTWYDPSSMAALQTRRLSRGKNSRLKTLRFLDDGVWRERFEPASSADLDDPGRWRRQSGVRITYPVARNGEAVLTPVMLFQRAAELVATDLKVREQLVFTDTQLYRVTLRAAPAGPIEADVSVVEGSEARSISGERLARRVAVLPALLGDSPEKEPFTLLELGGEISVFIDVESRLPLRVQGNWLQVGTITAELARAELRANCTP